MNTSEYKELLNDFLNRWTLENVQQMELRDYVGVNNHDTFCYWLEHKMEKLGSIKGGSSIKFGIYEKANTEESPKQYFEDFGYLWQRKEYGNDKNTVFSIIKKNILKTINFSKNGKFAEIDDISLPNTLKWKVAFLYSNERLIPIYKQEVLFAITKSFEYNTKKISEIQCVMIKQKPENLDVYQYGGELWNRFGNNEKENLSKKITETVKKHFPERSESLTKNIIEQVRNLKGQSIIATQNHNKIQNKLYEILVEKYGKKKVKLEKNYIDITLIQPDNTITLFEVKSDISVSDCIVKALGQILRYSFRNTTEKPHKLCVVGQFEPNEEDKKFIDFINKNLSFEFKYEKVDIE